MTEQVRGEQARQRREDLVAVREGPLSAPIPSVPCGGRGHDPRPGGGPETNSITFGEMAKRDHIVSLFHYALASRFCRTWMALAR
jgi:hypothetical protein